MKSVLAGGGATLDIGVPLAHRLRYLAGAYAILEAATAGGPVAADILAGRLATYQHRIDAHYGL